MSNLLKSVLKSNFDNGNIISSLILLTISVTIAPKTNAIAVGKIFLLDNKF